jgi:acyl carrier protein
MLLGFDSADEIEPDLGFFKMGMDSITTVKLKCRLEENLGRTLPPTIAFEYPTVVGLAGYLAKELPAGTEAPREEQAETIEAPPAPQRPETASPVEDDLSEEELTALLADKLRQSMGEPDDTGGSGGDV